MMLKLQKYNLIVQFKTGRELHMLDMLSRACISKDETQICDENYSKFFIDNLPCLQSKLFELKEETLRDM